MLKSFSTMNYRNFENENLTFQKINLLVGPNNSGKTNLITAISFLADIILSEGKNSAFVEQIDRHGWDDILNRKKEKPDTISMKWAINTNKKYPDLTYELAFKVDTADQIPRGFYITEEKLGYKEPSQLKEKPFRFFECHGPNPGYGFFSVKDNSGKNKNTKLEVDVYDTVFRQLQSLLDSERFRIDIYPNFKEVVQSVKSFFEGFYSFSSTAFDIKAIKEPVKINLDSKYLSRTANNYVNVLYYLDEKYEFLEKYTNILQEAIPDLAKLKISHPTESKIDLKLQIKDDWYKMSEMSDGTIKIMILALLLSTPEKMTAIAFDEPELNLHPAWLKIISKWLLNTQSTSQIFISTHSPDLLDGFTEVFSNKQANLYAFNLKDVKKIKHVTPNTLVEFLHEGWKLGDLYRVGEPLLGGWPW
jgi:predicted ATPase